MLFVKPANFTMPDKYLESLKKKNPDGLSFYNKENGEVFKTLNYEEGFEYLADNHENELVVHFRLGTSGAETLDQLHGFSICNDEYILFHNGVLRSIDGDFKGGKSDTQVLVNIFRDEPVERLIAYLETHEKTSRFLIVNKETREYTIPKCAKWNGDATIDGVHIMFSNNYAIDYKYLDSYSKWNTKWDNKNYHNTNSSSSYTTSSKNEFYEDLWKGYADDLEAELKEEDEKLTIQLLELIWKGERRTAMNLIKLYPEIAYSMILDLMGEEGLLTESKKDEKTSSNSKKAA